MLGGTADRTSIRRTTVVLVLGSGSHHGFDNAVLARSFENCRRYRDGTAAHDQDTLERNAPDDDTNNKHLTSRPHDVFARPLSGWRG